MSTFLLWQTGDRLDRGEAVFRFEDVTKAIGDKESLIQKQENQQWTARRMMSMSVSMCACLHVVVKDDNTNVH